MEEQRLKEEEIKRNKEELLAQYLKNKLEKEENMAKENLRVIERQWVELMRAAKSKELKKEITILSQVFERNLDRLESVKEGLMKDINEAEEQFLMAKRSHLQSIDKLINFQKRRLEKMNRDFKEQEDLILHEFEVERSFVVEQHRQEVFRLENIIYAMEETFLEKEMEGRAEFQSNMDELKNKNLEDVHTLRLRQENLLEGFFSQFKDAMKVYEEATEERKKGFDELKEKDDKSTREIEMQSKRIEKIQNDIRKEKARIKSLGRDWDAKGKEIKHERDILGESLLCLQKKLEQVQSFEKDQIAKLIHMTRNAIMEMKEKVVKGESILKAAERCRKLESEREKVTPFYQSSLSKSEQINVDEVMQEEPKEKLTKMLNNFLHQENFWKRFNKVKLENVALTKENLDLMEVNKSLSDRLKDDSSDPAHFRELSVEGQQTNFATSHISPTQWDEPAKDDFTFSYPSDLSNENFSNMADRNVKTRKHVQSNALHVRECSFAPRKVVR